jgi:hypothetical protein
MDFVFSSSIEGEGDLRLQRKCNWLRAATTAAGHHLIMYAVIPQDVYLA